MNAFVLPLTLEPVLQQAAPSTGPGNVNTAVCGGTIPQSGVGCTAGSIARSKLVETSICFITERHAIVFTAIVLDTSVSPR